MTSSQMNPNTSDVPNGQSRQRRRIEAAILKAFATLIQQQSYDDLTVNDIVDYADVGRTTFYRHFDNKAALLVRLHSARFAELGVVPHSRAGWLAAKPAPALVNYLEEAQQDERTQILICRLGAKDALIQQLHDAALTTHFEQQLRRAFSPADLQLPLPVLANATAGSASWLLRWWVESSTTDTPQQMAAYIQRTISSIVRGTVVGAAEGQSSRFVPSET
ncbi:MAG: TetR/AcrR family transcriptional regulator [Chloroflexota bacterium]